MVGAQAEGGIGAGDFKAGLLVQCGEAVVAGALGGGLAQGAASNEVALGMDVEEVAGFELSAEGGEVAGGVDVDGVGGEAAALLVHGVGVDVDEVTGLNGAGVGEGVGVDGGAGGSHEGAVLGEVAGAGAQVEAGDEGAGGGAVRQLDVLLDEPDDVAGELGQLVGTEGNAGAQLVLFGDGEAGVQEGAVLVVVVGVAVQAAAAGELGDLFADEALFVVAVAEAFVEGVVVAQGVELAVGAGVGAAEGKAGVGGDEGGGVGVNGEEAVVG